MSFPTPPAPVAHQKKGLVLCVRSLLDFVVGFERDKGGIPSGQGNGRESDNRHPQSDHGGDNHHGPDKSSTGQLSPNTGFPKPSLPNGKAPTPPPQATSQIPSTIFLPPPSPIVTQPLLSHSQPPTMTVETGGTGLVAAPPPPAETPIGSQGSRPSESSAPLHSPPILATRSSSSADSTSVTIINGTGLTVPNSDPSSSTSATSASSKVDGGAIAGGILGALVLLVLVLFAVVFVRRRRRTKKPSAEVLNYSFQNNSSSAENSVAYPFSSDHARHNRSSMSEISIIGQGFTFPPQKT